MESSPPLPIAAIVAPPAPSLGALASNLSFPFFPSPSPSTLCRVFLFFFSSLPTFPLLFFALVTPPTPLPRPPLLAPMRASYPVCRTVLPKCSSSDFRPCLPIPCSDPVASHPRLRETPVVIMHHCRTRSGEGSNKARGAMLTNAYKAAFASYISHSSRSNAITRAHTGTHSHSHVRSGGNDGGSTSGGQAIAAELEKKGVAGQSPPPRQRGHEINRSRTTKFAINQQTNDDNENGDGNDTKNENCDKRFK